jgi:hypothetical protein
MPVCLAGSILGLLCLRIGPYDESAMLLGARLLRAGKLPYTDFYTFYGPLGYTLTAPFLSLGNPGVALRVAQGAALLVLCALIFAIVRRVGKGALLAEALGAGCVIAFSSEIGTPSFFGFLFVAAALAFTVLGETVLKPVPRHLLAFAAGMMLAPAFLVRPAFGAYAAVGILLLKALAGPGGPSRTPRGLSPTLLLITGTAAGFSILWMTLYAELSLPVMFYSAVVFPGKLIQTGARFLYPNLAPAGSGPVLSLLFSAAAGLALFGLTIVWAYAVPGRRARWLAAAATITGGLLPFSLRFSRRPGRDSALVSVLLLVLATLTLAATRTAVRKSLLLRSAALCGITAAAFLHYFWSRADREHLTPALALATAAALFCFPGFRLPGRVIVAALLLFEWHFVLASNRFAYPILALWREASAPAAPRGFQWPAEEFEVDAINAVALADRYADPASRFVAVSSNQGRSEGSAIVLFLLSSRLPYTKFYAYDPGLQSSVVGQRMMIEELERSGSRTAVVWQAEHYSDRRPPAERTAFDRRFDELYPSVVATFGIYQVRNRGPEGANPSQAGSAPVSR